MFRKITKFNVSIKVSLKEIPDNCRDFANKTLYYNTGTIWREEGVQKEAQNCCVIILLTLGTCLFFVLLNSNTGWRLLLGRIFLNV